MCIGNSSLSLWPKFFPYRSILKPHLIIFWTVLEKFDLDLLLLDSYQTMELVVNRGHTKITSIS